MSRAARSRSPPLSPPSPPSPPLRNMSRAPSRQRSGEEIRVRISKGDRDSVSVDETLSDDIDDPPPPPKPASFKRLVVCCDGTWLDSNSALTEDGFTLTPPSNITRLTRCIRSMSAAGVPQIVYYQQGVGTSGGLTNKIIGGGTGAGLGDNVREAYSFIANNYLPGDEIFLLGFSRGAFTARSIGGLIGHIGVMTKKGLDSFPVVFKDFSHRYQKSYKSHWPNVPFPDKPHIRDPMYTQEMQRRGLTRLNVRIRCIAVFDTVGSLGIPRISWLGRFGKRTLEDQNEYAFYDTTLDECVDNAFQALALDERRTPFSPALWEKRGNRTTNLIQVWFPGCHGNTGGGCDDQELANITLAWMMAMLGPLLDLDMSYVLKAADDNYEYYESRARTPRPWSFGKILDSVTGIYAASGATTRTPGQYCRTDPKNGNPTNRPLRNTNEYIHSSVRARVVKRGPGVDDKGDYDPKAMRDWQLRSEQAVEGLPTPWYWENVGDRANTILPEAPLRNVEKRLLGESPDEEIEAFVLDPPAPPPPTRRRRRRSPP